MILSTESQPGGGHTLVANRKLRPPEQMAHEAAEEQFEHILNAMVNVGQRTIVESLRELYMEKSTGYHMGVYGDDEDADEGFTAAWQERISPRLWDVVSQAMMEAADMGREWNEQYAASVEGLDDAMTKGKGRGGNGWGRSIAKFGAYAVVGGGGGSESSSSRRGGGFGGRGFGRRR